MIAVLKKLTFKNFNIINLENQNEVYHFQKHDFIRAILTLKLISNLVLNNSA